MKHDVIVIGGGASGMLAAGCAAENGARVLLLERNKRLGNKLRITGKGRCNLTNTCETAEFIEGYGRNGKFLYRALREFSNQDLVRFFNQQGVDTKEERGGRIFPVSDKAVDVVNALERYMSKHNVTVKLNSRVGRIELNRESNAVTGVALKNRAKIIESGKIILATGGLSYPGTGSTGDGYAMAKQLGHSVVPLQPALVPFETVEKFPKDLQGLSLENVEVTVLCDSRKITTEFGDMLFTHFGVSGPIILRLSGRIVECLDNKKAVILSINLKPALDEGKITNRFLREFSGSGKKSLKTIIKGMLPRALVPVFIEASAIPGDKRCNQITGDERKALVRLMMDFRVTVKRARSYAEAIITRGGIDLKEIDPRTMESTKVKGLYFCGEIIDIDGITGGYNLQAAFSTGYLAAISM
ncbi:MAG: NAD(P)/FAD-dependent oxidoreductase [Candidatus Latescibacterota bacterium]